MDFGGDLAVLDAALIFQILNMSGLTGVLKLIAIDNVARFYVREGELLYATIETRRKRIGQFLVEKKIISKKQLDETLEEYKAVHATKNRILKGDQGKGSNRASPHREGLPRSRRPCCCYQGADERGGLRNARLEEGPVCVLCECAA